jgi:hypothetical protein
VIRKESTTIAILGGTTVAGLALSLLLKSVSYKTIVLKAPPAGPAEDLLHDVDLLLVSPDLDHERRNESLSILRGTKSVRRIPVLAFSSAVEKSLFAEDAAPSWPVEIAGLARDIELALVGEPETGAAFVTNPVGGEAATSEINSPNLGSRDAKTA